MNKIIILNDESNTVFERELTLNDYEIFNKRCERENISGYQFMISIVDSTLGIDISGYNLSEIYTIGESLFIKIKHEDLDKIRNLKLQKIL